MRLSSSSIVSLLLVAGTVVFIATSVGMYQSLEQVVARNQTRDHARQAQLLIRRMGMLFLDLETGQRGFIITGRPAFLEPYDRARRDFDDTYSALKDHLDGIDPVPMDLHTLDELSHRRLAQVERNVAQRWALGDAVLKDVSAFESGKSLMDSIRAELARLEMIQEERVRRADLSTVQVQKHAVMLAGALPVVGCALILGAAIALTHQGRRRDEAEQALLKANMALEYAVASRTKRLRDALTRIQNFASELDASIEAERKQLAREVHDQIGQIGTAMKMLALNLRRKLGDGHGEAVQELIALADEGINTARSISASLRPPLLDDFGLAAALDHYAQGLARRGGIEVAVDVRGDDVLTPAQANQLFRIVQEASTNVLRHAQAGRVDLTGVPLDAHGAYRLEIIDDGVGMGQVRIDASGLRNMRERAALSGGFLELGPGPGDKGTRVCVMLPLAARAEESATQEQS